MIITIPNPFAKKIVAPVPVAQSSRAAKAVETTMSAAAVAVPTVAVVKAKSGFIRFIDAIGSFFVHGAPVIEEAAEAAEPLLALTPFGPEYDLVVNAIVGVQKTATASLTTGGTLTSAQKMALVLQAVSPGVTAILASKGLTEPTAVEQAIAQFAQNVYNFQAGPVVVATATAAPVNTTVGLVAG